MAALHCYDRPTVELVLEVPRERGAGDWEWAPCAVIAPVREFVYTGPELCRVLDVYGRMLADATPPALYERVRIRAFGLFTGRTLGILEFELNPGTQRYVPMGDPMITLPPIHTWPDDVVRGWAVMTGRTGGKPCGSCPYVGIESPSEGRARVAAARCNRGGQGGFTGRETAV